LPSARNRRTPASPRPYSEKRRAQSASRPPPPPRSSSPRARLLIDLRCLLFRSVSMPWATASGRMSTKNGGYRRRRNLCLRDMLRGKLRGRFFARISSLLCSNVAAADRFRDEQADAWNTSEKNLGEIKTRTFTDIPNYQGLQKRIASYWAEGPLAAAGAYIRRRAGGLFAFPIRQSGPIWEAGTM